MPSTRPRFRPLLVASVARRTAVDEGAALVRALRVLPPPLAGMLRAGARWLPGGWAGARIAVAIAEEQLDHAAGLLAALPADAPARPRLTALLQWQCGDRDRALRPLEEPLPPGRDGRRTAALRRRLTAELAVLTPPRPQAPVGRRPSPAPAGPRPSPVPVGRLRPQPGRVPYGRIRPWYAALDVFVVPRTAARVCELVTPLKPVEAMGLGLPVVGSDVGGLRDLVAPGRTGLLVPPGDPVALADCLQALHRDPGLGRDLGAAARTEVAATRTWDVVAQGYLAAYRRLGVPVPAASSVCP